MEDMGNFRGGSRSRHAGVGGLVLGSREVRSMGKEARFGVRKARREEPLPRKERCSMPAWEVSEGHVCRLGLSRMETVREICDSRVGSCTWVGAS